MVGYPDDFDRHWEAMEDRIRGGEVTREQADNTWGAIIGMKLGMIGSAIALGVLLPGVGAVVGMTLLAGGTVGGAKLGHELTKPKG